ncbi:hypothetical protein Pmani_038279 [Petrolisthes manimaculis]|uniref:Uncharacterized protein n=1 Tax=Petrolisthes manimaculis TaxID=1843537 RepID=A0AAE1NF66_9EUCA|nr:hypothetical protein Pmani_038279 [Petrolisthes manimaculis]
MTTGTLQEEIDTSHSRGRSRSWKHHPQTHQEADQEAGNTIHRHKEGLQCKLHLVADVDFVAGSEQEEVGHEACPEQQSFNMGSSCLLCLPSHPHDCFSHLCRDYSLNLPEDGFWR